MGRPLLSPKIGGEHFWGRWLDRLDKYYIKIFGEDWKEKNENKEFLKKTAPF
jgi:hypothetical protein